MRRRKRRNSPERSFRLQRRSAAVVTGSPFCRPQIIISLLILGLFIPVRGGGAEDITCGCSNDPAKGVVLCRNIDKIETMCVNEGGGWGRRGSRRLEITGTSLDSLSLDRKLFDRLGLEPGKVEEISIVNGSLEILSLCSSGAGMRCADLSRLRTIDLRQNSLKFAEADPGSFPRLEKIMLGGELVSQSVQSRSR